MIYSGQPYPYKGFFTRDFEPEIPSSIFSICKRCIRKIVITDDPCVLPWFCLNTKLPPLFCPYEFEHRIADNPPTPLRLHIIYQNPPDRDTTKTILQIDQNNRFSL